MMNEKPKGLFFEEFKIGDTFTSAERKITEEEVMCFAELSGDHNRIHTDREYAESAIFGERIAHGMLGLSITSGLAAKLGFAEDTIIALRSISWKFKAPIKFGNSIRGTFVVSEKKELKGNAGGLLIFDVKVQNQKEEIVQMGKWTMLIKMKIR
jgi:acyl dehydratase